MKNKWKSAAARRIRELTGKSTVEAATVEIGRRLTDGQKVPPIDLEAILPRVGVHRAFPDPKMTIAGELRKVEGGLEIAYSQSDSSTRRRFTVAHEIAHAVFERTGPHCPRRGQELERICNLIASEILVPQHSLTELAKHPLNLKEISRLAAVYRTSLTSMMVRCAQQFGLIGAETVCDEITWIQCPPTANVIAPRAQLQRLTALSCDKPVGRQPCTFDIRGSALDMTMEWVTTGDSRKLFVFSDPPR